VEAPTRDREKARIREKDTTSSQIKTETCDADAGVWYSNAKVYDAITAKEDDR